MSDNRSALCLATVLVFGACGGEVWPASPPDAGGLVTTGTFVGDASTIDSLSADLGTVIPANAVSLKTYAVCDGTTDDWAAVTKAFADAAHDAFPLLVDCAANIHIGLDISRPIFIDDGTTVIFSGAGKFIVDNSSLPAFVIVSSTNVTLTGWDVEWHGATGTTDDTGGYFVGSNHYGTTGGHVQAQGAFNSNTLTQWMAKHRGVTSPDHATAIWAGGVGPMALLHITGDASNLIVSGMYLHAPATVGVDQFIPMAVSISPNWKSNQVVETSTVVDDTTEAMPHDLHFTNVTLDGTYMGFLGGGQKVYFDHIVSKRYGDLQQADGTEVGGTGKWFPPPHLFYLNYVSGKTTLINNDIELHDIDDQGPRLGKARDVASDVANGTQSGYALSLKLGGVDCIVDGYKSARPDGFMDVLTSTNLSVSNVTATYDSSFINDVYPGWRWPSGPYDTVTFTHVTLTDTATTTTKAPVSSALGANSGIVFDDVRIALNAWSGSTPMTPTIDGQANDSAIEFDVGVDQAKTVYASSQSASAILTASATSLAPGGKTSLSWKSVGTTCSASWATSIPTSGTATVSPSSSQSYWLTCVNGMDTATATVPVVVN